MPFPDATDCNSVSTLRVTNSINSSFLRARPSVVDVAIDTSVRSGFGFAFHRSSSTLARTLVIPP